MLYTPKYSQATTHSYLKGMAFKCLIIKENFQILYQGYCNIIDVIVLVRNKIMNYSIEIVNYSIDTNKYKCNNIFINNRRSNTMILDAIQSKLATLRDMNNSGNIDSVKMDVILDELELLSKIIAYPTSYKVERISGRTINVKLSFDTVTDGITIEF